MLNPHYEEICEGYAIPYDVAVDRTNLREKVEKMFSTSGPYLLECAIKEEDNVLPMTPPGKSVNEMMLSIEI
jgi:acetolactate synthase-1/2/3 large subunit